MGTLGFFSQLGKTLGQGTIGLTNAFPSFAIVLPNANDITDLYVVHITTNDTAVETITISDAVTTLTYFVGGAAGGNNQPLYDQAAVPLRFKKGATITVAANAVTAGKQTNVNMRWLFNKT